MPQSVVAPPVPSLTRLGLSVHADLVFRTLARFGVLTATEVAGSLDLHVPRVTAALDELVAAGAVEPGSGGPVDRTWRARPIDQAIAAVISYRARSRMKARRLGVQLARLEDLVTLPRRVSQETYTEIPGIDPVRARIAALSASQNHEFLSMNPGTRHDEAAVRAARPVSHMQFVRGVSARSLEVPLPPSADDPTVEHEREARAYGRRFRELDALPVRMLVFDRRTAILLIDPAHPGVGAWEIRDEPVVAKLVEIFEAHWERGYDRTRDWIPPMTMSPRERDVVALMAAGHTDATIAVTLRVSVRTVAYTLSGLMERYQAKNRFQLGLLLGAQAQVPPADPDGTEEGTP
ncbi:MAG: hypothetical protein HOU81_05200 [Hamadaea sp.]|uniref:helix-turn-helix transcriptional regulator n=1 Tax=Hamadaea sp. TaxID=2024425 RepID=UPI001793777C|nr:LuxR family transcriptional regulator [Hamadaea sp.]NUR70194.1 hypothetical protein [Hamadaea sp.]NUT24139.1 hypothetical protein [Hamadaea sp.]